jgi:hypothetical protein
MTFRNWDMMITLNLKRHRFEGGKEGVPTAHNSCDAKMIDFSCFAELYSREMMISSSIIHVPYFGVWTKGNVDHESTKIESLTPKAFC